MRGCLEIGEEAERYFLEESYEQALEKFQSCLKVLVPLLGKEPPGRRKELLGKQVRKIYLIKFSVVILFYFSFLYIVLYFEKNFN